VAENEENDGNVNGYDGHRWENATRGLHNFTDVMFGIAIGKVGDIHFPPTSRAQCDGVQIGLNSRELGGNIVFKAGSSNFCQIWLLAFVVNVLLHVNPDPFVKIRTLDRVIRKMKSLQATQQFLNVSRSTHNPSIQRL